ncbi:DUF308 domain-containing protein [Hoyosella sp. G463]|uniref:DUF308 domain-containing protein n=1 Tax=Lolliginicoccus lacisalsi TaxID=2742202 RepID=A0A927PMS0_9ACTN|nr:lipase family protein [Lolliginicoccus lacisalsi]MBD8506736.1 DUF308 domain-containing protein [Lolliginicoccus lacisalsi]
MTGQHRLPPTDTETRENPRWLLLVVGVVCIAVGAALLFKPFASLAVLVGLVAAGLVVLGIGDLATARAARSPSMAVLTGVAWLAAGVAVVAWPGATIGVVALIAGLALLVSGAAQLAQAVRGTTDERIAALLFGAASIILGVLALAWPDVTVFVVAFLVGARLLFYGVARIIELVRGRRTKAGSRGKLARFGRAVTAAAALLLVIALAVVSSMINAGAPSADDFYAAPDELPAEPGVLLRSEPFDRAVPDGAQAWRILYTTSRDDDQAAVASALVVAPQELPPGPRPVVAWAHGTTGATEACAPSVLPDPFEAGATPGLQQVVDNGWVMVSTDYVGLGTEGPHPYLIGEGEARSVLDAVRAARELPDVQLEEETVVWGHSQGGHAALWTGILAPDYAPDVNVTGVAALAPASDLTGLVSNLDAVPGGAIFASYVIDAYAAIYPDVEFGDYVRPAARIPVREMAARCLAEPAVFASIVETLLFDRPVFHRDPTSGPLGERLAENVPSDPLTMPLLIGQGEADPLVLPAAQEEYARSQCAAGTAVDYRTYPGRDHVAVVLDPDSELIPDLFAWTQDRMDGRPAGTTC